MRLAVGVAEGSTTSRMKSWQCVSPTPATRTRYGEVPAYREGLYQLANGLFAWMVPNGSWGESNAGLIVGDGEALLVDTLFDLPCTRQMLDALNGVLEGKPIKYVINTHADGDHCWGNQLLPTAQIIATNAAAEEMRHVPPRSAALLDKVGRIFSLIRVGKADKVGHWLRGMFAPYQFRGIKPTPPGLRFDGELEMTVGGRTVRLIEVGPAHTLGDAIVHVPDARTVFAGDVVFVGSTPVMWAGPVENLIGALDRILSLDVDVVVPGHGPITDKAGVERVKEYLQFVDVESRQRFSAGLSAQKAARDIALSPEFARRFAAWNSPERIVVNVNIMYRHLAGQRGSLNKLQMANVLRKQALLAIDLPDAEPQVMRKR